MSFSECFLTSWLIALMLRVKISTPGRLAKNWKAPAPVMCISGFDERVGRGGGGEGFGNIVVVGTLGKVALSGNP